MNLEETLTVGDLMLNTKTFEVLRGSQNIWLSRKEFDLLAYLLKNADRTVSKDELIGSVWPTKPELNINSVEVYIGYLRNKVEDPFPSQPRLIHTRRGFGYMLSNNARWAMEVI